MSTDAPPAVPPRRPSERPGRGGDGAGGQDGPDGVVLREAARRIGVSPSAAYRHFPSREGLLAVVGSEARRALAARMIAAMDAAAGPRKTSTATKRFRACGREYIRFALDEPGLFAVAFRPCPPELFVPEDPSPYHILSGSLDELDRAGCWPCPGPASRSTRGSACTGRRCCSAGARSIRGSATGSSRGPSTWSPTACWLGPETGGVRGRAPN